MPFIGVAQGRRAGGVLVRQGKFVRYCVEVDPAGVSAEVQGCEQPSPTMRCEQEASQKWAPFFSCLVSPLSLVD